METVTREIVTQANDLDESWPFDTRLMHALIDRAAQAQGRSVEQAGSDAVLEFLIESIWDNDDPRIDPAVLRNPSPEVVTTFIRFLRDKWNRSGERHLFTARYLLTLPVLLHIWQTGGRDDVVTEVFRRLEWMAHRDSRFVAVMIAELLFAGFVHLPYRDAMICRLMCHLGLNEPYPWRSLAAGAIYATARRYSSHVPTIDGIDDLIHT